MLFSNEEIKNHAAKISLYLGSKNADNYFCETLAGKNSDYENIIRFYMKKARDNYISTIHLYVNQFDKTYTKSVDYNVSVSTQFVRHALRIGVPLNVSFVLHQFPDEASMRYTKNEKLLMSHSLCVITLFLKCANILNMKLFIHFEDEKTSLKFDPSIEKYLDKVNYTNLINVNAFADLNFSYSKNDLCLFKNLGYIDESYIQIDKKIEAFVEQYQDDFISLKANLIHEDNFMKKFYIISKLAISCYEKGIFFNISIEGKNDKYLNIENCVILDPEKGTAKVTDA